MTKIAWLVFWPAFKLKAYHDRIVARVPALGVKLTPKQAVCLLVIGFVLALPIAGVETGPLQAIAMVAVSILAIVFLAASKR